MRAKRDFSNLYGSFSAGDDVSSLPAHELNALIAADLVEGEITPAPTPAPEAPRPARKKGKA